MKMRVKFKTLLKKIISKHAKIADQALYEQQLIFLFADVLLIRTADGITCLWCLMCI